MTVRSRTLAALFLLVAGAFAPVTAQRPGFAPERLARVDSVLQQYVDEGRIAGAVALVLQDGRPVYERAFGWSDREAGVRMAPNTIFRIASQTKALTSAAILMLLEEGRLTLDEPVGRHIQSFRRTTVALRGADTVAIVPARRPITIRDLLTHTAGISYGTTGEIAALYERQGLGRAAGFGWYTADLDEPICTTMERLGTLPFIAQPGEAWVYGYSTDVLGCIVERVSGIDLAEFIRSRITEPLGMADTHFYLDDSERARLAAVYASDSAGLAVRAPDGARGQGHYIDGPRRSFAGGAGLVSTAHDYARFLEMVRSGGALNGVRILAPRTVKLMTTNQVGSLYSSTGLGWSLAFETIERYGASGMGEVGSYGWGGAYGSWYRVDPEAGLVMVFMIQLMPNGTDIRQKFPTLVYQA
ncbi:MAG TPA: serine hydrolase domain-containing protein, partial [Longimicrobiales bacterium]|nr:serine hydrolase domain-containing protein [Longimicrobiales bacterium]